MPKVNVPGIGKVNFPDDMSHDDIVAAIERDVIPQYEASIKHAGVMEAGIGGAKRLGESILTAGESPFFGAEEAATRGVGRQAQITERPGFSEDAIKYAYEKAGQGLPGYWAGAKEFLSQIPSAAAEQAANIGVSLAGARAGAMLPGPPQVKALGALAGAFLPSAIPQFGADIERKAQEDIQAGRPVDIDTGKSTIAAAGQGALDVLGLKLGLGHLLGIPAAKMGTAEAEKVLARNLIKAGAMGVGKTALAEIPTEVTQQMLERWQAGLPLTDDDAMAEYRQTALQTAASVAPFGGMETMSHRGEARQVLAADEAKKREEALARERAAQEEAQRQEGIQRQAASQEQLLADLTGRKAVQDELARFDDETKQKVVDTLAKLRAAKNEAEVQSILQDDEDTRKILEMYADDERRATTFGEHTLEELGIPKRADIVDLLSPLYDKPISELHGAIENRLERIKTLNKGEKDDEINARIDEYLTKHLGSTEETTAPTGELPIDRRWQGELAKYMDLASVMPEGRRFTEGPAAIIGGKGLSPQVQQYQPDLLMPGESANNPVLNVSPTARTEPQQMLQEETRTGVTPSGKEVTSTLRAAPLTLEDVLRGGAYDPNTDRQAELGFEPDDSGAGVAGDMGDRGELARNRALELPRVEGTGNAPATDVGVQGPFTGPLDPRAKAWTNNMNRISKILNNEKLVTPEEQAKGVNQIARMLEKMGFSGKSVPTMIDKDGKPAGVNSPAMAKALEITKNHAKWPAQPEFVPKKRATTQTTAPHRTGQISKLFDPVWRMLHENERMAKNNEARQINKEHVELAGELEDALLDADPDTALKMLQEVNTRLESAQLNKPMHAQAKKVLERMRAAVEQLAGEDIQQARRRNRRATRGAQANKASETPATVEKIQSELESMLNQEALKRTPPVVVNDYDELQQYVDSGDISEADLESARTGAKAFVKGGTKDYYIASQIPENDIRGTILHERGTHMGLPKLIGQLRINALSNRVLKWGVEGKGLEGKIAQEAIDLADKSGEPIGSDRHSQEVVAYFTEIAVNRFPDKFDPQKTYPKEYAKVAQWLRDLWTSVLNAVRKLHMNPDSLTAKDIVDLVYGAARVEGLGTEAEMGVVPSGVVNPDGSLEMITKPEAAQESRMPESIRQPWAQQKQIQDAKKELDRVTQVYRNNPEHPKVVEAKKAYEQALEQKPIQQSRQFFTAPKDKTFREKVQETYDKGMDPILDLLRVKLVGGGEALARKGVEMFGPETRLNPTTKRELGYLNYHRATHDTDLATGALERGYLDFDKEGVAHIKESADNMIALNDRANALKTAMKNSGMTDDEVYDAFAHMMLTDRFRHLQQMGVLSKSEFTDEDHQYGKDLQKKFASEYKAWQDMYQRIRRNTMNATVQSGLFTRKQAQEFLDRLEYIPFNREKMEGQPEGVFLRSLLSANVDYHIKGSDRPVNDIMNNIVDNQVWLLKRAVRNNASNLIAETMEEMNRRNPLLGGYPIKFDDKQGNNIRYRKNGVDQWFKVLDKNDAAIFAAAPAVSNTAIRFFRTFSNYLRKGVTLMPSFFYSQIVQDAMRAPVVAGTEKGMFGLMGKSLPEFARNWRSETPMARTLRNAGIIGQIDYQDTYDNWKKELLGNERSMLGKILEKGERMAQANDLATRTAVYEDILKKTGDANEASLRALMMINFQNRGHSQFMNYLMAVVPFVNSRIQGEYRLLQALNGKIPGVTKEQAKQLIFWRVAKFAAYTMLYAMIVGDDDDYERANEQVKNNNFLLNGVKIPVAPEFLPLKVAVEQTYRKLSGDEFATDAKVARAMISATSGLLFGAGDMVPTALKPVLENTTNYSFFTGRQLVGYGLQARDVNQQFNENTSELSKSISNLMYELGGNTVAVSPIKIDNMIRGLFGTMGRDALFMTDILSGEKPEAKMSQTPLIAGFFYDTEAGGLKSDFYELKDKSDRAKATFNDLKTKDREAAIAYLDANRALININSRVNRIADWMTMINKKKQAAVRSNPETARATISDLEAQVYERLKLDIPRLYDRVNEEQQ